MILFVLMDAILLSLTLQKKTTVIRIDLLSLSSPLTSGHFWYTFSPALVLGQQSRVSNTIGQKFSENVAEME